MKRKSFRTRLIALVVMLVLLTVTSVVAVSLSLVFQLCTGDAKESVTGLTDSFVSDANAMLSGVESAVQILYEEASAGFEEDASLMEDEEYRTKYLERISQLTKHLVENTDGVVCTYVYFNKDADYRDEYICYVQEGNTYVEGALEDVNQYSAEDYANVGWYYQTIANGKAGWLTPYFYRSYRMNLFSYTIPIYSKNKFVALVGMDMDLGYLQRKVASLHAYDSGYGYLLSENDDILYHPQYPKGAKYEQVHEGFAAMLTDFRSNKHTVQLKSYGQVQGNVWVTSKTLINNMQMGMVVSQHEVLHPVWIIINRIIIVTIVILILEVFVTIAFIQTMTKPLKELTAVAEKMAEGNLNTPITYAGRDEFGRLADAFRVMKARLQQSLNTMSNLAYTDIMTGVNNKGAFERDLEGVYKTCRKNQEQFALIVADVNDLKHINDSEGHNAGDELIKGVAAELMKVFGKRNTYRVGGDEFSIIIRNCYEAKIRDDLNRFQSGVYLFSESNQKLFHRPVSVAAGYALSDWKQGDSVKDIYRRADEMMYENKKEMKAEGSDSN